jgi:hypothetical protein
MDEFVTKDRFFPYKLFMYLWNAVHMSHVSLVLRASHLFTWLHGHTKVHMTESDC